MNELTAQILRFLKENPRDHFEEADADDLLDLLYEAVDLLEAVVAP